MALRDISDTLTDFARTGLVVGRKMYNHAVADERGLDPGAVAELVSRLHPDRVPVTVSQVIEETESTKTLRLVPSAGVLPPFKAGQFMTLFLDVEGVKTARAYSISSPPTRPGHVDFTVREARDGFVSKYLCNDVLPGDEFEVSGPAGNFFYEPLTDTDSLVLLAGGSGVTPFMSMIREAADSGSDVDLHLIYGSRVPTDVIFGNELTEIARRVKNFKFDVVMSEPPEGYGGPCGLLDSTMIRSRIGGIEGKTFFLCGPHAMYGLCTAALEDLGVRPGRIRVELSGPPPDITAVEGWPSNLKGDEKFEVRIAGTRKKFKVAPAETLMNAMDRNGVVVDCLCRSGACGVCRSKLLEGEVFMPPGLGVRKADVAFGFIHPCMSYAISDVTLSL